MANELSQLSPPKGSTKKRTRVGRGEGSGKGKTAGRGSKGQHARNTVAPWFEGGQMPLHRRLPKRGFTNIHGREVASISIEQLASVFKAGDTINAQSIKDIGLLSTIPAGGIKIIGSSNEEFELKSSFTIHATDFTVTAINAVRAAGGSAIIDKTYLERRYATVKIGRINARFNDGDVVDAKSLVEKNLISHIPYHGVWVIGGGSIRKNVTVKAAKFSAAASKAIQAAGGSAEVIENGGFNLTISDYTVVRIRDINSAFEGSEPGTVVNAESIVSKGLASEIGTAGVWITGGKKLKRAGLKIEANHIDSAARARIEAAKGQCVIL
jgi:large subunit ribosomal protein L15